MTSIRRNRPRPKWLGIDVVSMRHFEAAADALRRGELVILPTETVYGLGADAANPIAVAKIFEAKGRPKFNPLIAHVRDLEHAENIAVFDDRARLLAEAFWPGPLTLVLPVRDRTAVCDLARAGLDTVAVRFSRSMLWFVQQEFDGAIVAPSANRSGRPSPTNFLDAIEETGFATAFDLNGSDSRIGLESTVVSVLDDIRLLRPGAVTRDEIEAIVGPLAEAEEDAKRSPGRLTLHYAPDAPVRINAEAPRDGEVFLAFGQPGPFSLSPTGDLKEAAANLFRMLREADRSKPAGIAVAPIPMEGLGEAINDRLKRAAGFVG